MQAWRSMVEACDAHCRNAPHPIFQSRRSRLFWHLKCRLALRHAARIVTVSEASKQGLMRTFNLSANRVCVLPEAPSAVFSPRDCKSDAHRAALALYNLRPDERYLLYVGGISPHKNLGTLIEGFAQL